MKKILLFLCITSACSSCIKEPDYGKKDEATFDLTTEYTVTPQNGQIAIVTKTGSKDTVCITGIPTVLTMNRATKYTTEYVATSAMPEYKNSGVWRYQQTLCFEDTDQGDYDYNDLILYVHGTHFQSAGTAATGWQETYRAQFKITPIACGSIFNIGFGFETIGGKTYMITDNCREYFFNGDKGYINTEKEVDPVVYPTKQTEKYELGTGWNATRINFFIVADGHRHYIATAAHWEEQFSYTDIFNKSGMPYGLSIPDYFEYPAERNNMFDTYPDFDNWVKGKTDTFRNRAAVRSLLYRPYEQMSQLFHF